MSDQITTARILEFNARVNHLLQQRRSKFRDAVEVSYGHKGKSASLVDQVGLVELQEKPGRHADLPVVSIPIARRWVTPTPFQGREFLDTTDLARMLWDPRSKYAEAFANGANRLIDRVVNSAFLGTALVGESGTTPEAFDTTNFQIVHGSVGLTIAKLRLVREKFQNAEVDLDNEELFMAIGPQQENNLLAETQVVSKDYNERRDGKPVLSKGRLESFLGFNFIVTNRLSKASTTRSCVAWVKSGMHLAYWERGELQTPIDWIAEKQAWQIAATMDFGATRLEQGRVIEVQATEV